MNDLERLVADLRGAGFRVNKDARRVVAESGDRVRDEARRLAPKRGLPHYAGKITSETGISDGGPFAEIGPERGGQGSLGHILEFGTSRTGPKPHLHPAAEGEADRFVRALLGIADPLEGR